MGAAAAEHGGGTGRRRNPAQPFGQQHHDRQGADAPALMRLAIGALPGGLRLFGRRRRQVDDRPRLGRPGRHLRARRRVGRDRALLANLRDRDRRCRSRPHPPGATAHQHLRRQCPGRRRSRVPHDRLRFRGTGGAARAAPRDRAVPLRAGRPGDARRQLLRGLQHPGPGSRPATAGDRVEKARDRRLRRARIRRSR